MEFAYIFRVLLRRKWIILISTVVAIVAGYFFTKNMKYSFRSSAQLSTGFTVTEEIKLADDKFNLGEIDVKFNNAIENITSAKVLSLLSYRMMLHDLEDPKPFTTLTPKQQQNNMLKKVSKKDAVILLRRKLDSTEVLSSSVQNEKDMLNFIDVYGYDVSAIKRGLTVGRFQRTDYINIDYVSNNPYLSAFAVNTLCYEFKRFFGLDQRERTDKSIVALDSLVNQKKAIFDQKIQEKNQFMTSAGVLDVGLEGSSKMGQVSTFESQLIEEKANQQNLSYQVTQMGILIENAKSRGLTTVLAPVTTNTKGNNSEYLTLRKQYNDLNADYMAKGANDIEIKKKLDNISLQMQKINFQDNSGTSTTENESGPISIDQLVQRKVGLEGQLRATTQKISAIQSKIGQLNGGLNGMAAKSANINQLDKEIEMASSEYKEASQRYSLALNMNSPISGVFKQRMNGEPALNPEPSKKFMVIAVSAISAFIIACLIIIGIEFFDNSVKTPSQFQRLTNLPLIGAINWVKFENNNILERVTHHSDEKEHRDNIFRELLRKLRYELANGKKKIYLFTSTEPNQGKTLMIQSLAYSLSLSKKKVLIIDTNFCNNDLTKATSATPVLEKFSLNGKEFEIDDIKSYITKTKAEGVDIIGCEGGDYTPSEILPKNHLLNYLDQLREEYDYIFMEGAPLNGFTDTKELIKYADGLIAIFSAEATWTAADKESVAFFKDHKDKFIGAVLNKVKEDNLNL